MFDLSKLSNEELIRAANDIASLLRAGRLIDPKAQGLDAGPNKRVGHLRVIQGGKFPPPLRAFLVLKYALRSMTVIPASKDMKIDVFFYCVK